MTSATGTAHRYFVWLYAQNVLRLRYRGAWLGAAWSILQPALYLVLMAFVFAVVNRASLRDYVVYLFAGLIPWRFLEQAALGMMESVPAHGMYTRKVRVPLFYFPAVQFLVALVDFFVAFGILVAVLAWQQPWALPVIVLPAAVLVWAGIAAGLGLLLSVLFVFFRDIRPLVQMGLMFLLFTSTIYFKPETIAADATRLRLLAWDPVCYWAALFQKPIYAGTWPLAADWTVSAASAAVLLAAGALSYRAAHNRMHYYL